MKSIAIYCGSSPGGRPEYAEMARQLGRILAHRGITLVYGGGHVGLMGAVADGVLDSGGHVIGVIPTALAKKELAHEGASEMRVVDSMHERKAMMVELADAFVALPGGFGTFDEFFELLTLIQTGRMDRVPFLLFGRAFWEKIINWDALSDAGTISAEDLDLFRFVETGAEAVELINNWGAPSARDNIPGR